MLTAILIPHASTNCSTIIDNGSLPFVAFLGADQTGLELPLFALFVYNIVIFTANASQCELPPLSLLQALIAAW